MIIVQVLGGLGNQLFQYAAARRVAVEKSLPLKVDVSAFDTYTLRSYKLNHFDIQVDIATPEEIRRFTRPDIVGKGKRWFARNILPHHLRPIYREQKQYQFEADILNTPRNVYLQGYFQNEGYFKPIEPVIRREFQVKEPLRATNAVMANHIKNDNAISIHIRRGDYASNPTTRAFHGLLPLTYYQTAVQNITELVESPHFYIFSDDPQWARENLEIDYPTTLVDHNDSSHDYEDLRLMSLCKHHIIANSSFSWWGAWLCENPEKIIYAPKKWLNGVDIDTQYAVPPEWQRV